MTAYAIEFRRERVSIACDSLAYVSDGETIRPLGSIAKVVPLPHLRAALIGRGMMVVLWSAAAQLLQRADLSTVERAAAALPAMLARASDAAAKDAALSDWRGMLIMEAVLIGWSPAERRFRMYTFNSYEDYAPADDGGENFGVLTFPNLGDLTPPVSGPFDRCVVPIMQAYRRFYMQHPESGAVGGNVDLWTLDAHGTTQRAAFWRFPDAERLQVEGEALTRAIVAGEATVDKAGSYVAAADGTTAEAVARATAPIDYRLRKAEEKRRRKEERAARMSGQGGAR